MAIHPSALGGTMATQPRIRIRQHDDALSDLRLAAAALIECADRYEAADPVGDPVGTLAALVAVEFVADEVRRAASDEALHGLPVERDDRLRGLLHQRGGADV